MAWGDKEAILAQNEGLRKEVALLREILEDKKHDIEELRASLRRTQEALVSKEAPEAYRDQKDAEAAAVREPTLEERERIERMREEAENTARYIDGLEDPLFKDAEDMVSKLAPILAPDPAMTSLHNDGES